MSKRLNLVGQKFGRLIVIADVGRDTRKNVLWLCRCKCGNETIVRGYHLTGGGTKSCGCLRDEKTIERNKQGNSIETRQKMSKSLKGKIPWNKGKPRLEETKRKISKSRIRLGLAKGKNNGNWKGGTSSKNILIRTSIEMKEWIQNIFKRDGYICQKCGKKGNKLQAHHIYPFAKWDFIRFELWNGITLCKGCHESIKGKELNYAKQFVELNFQKAVN
jgi:hypothetical protein